MKFECPACATVLNSKQPLRKGKRVSCARCGHGFLYPGEPEEPVRVYKPIILGSATSQLHYIVPPEPQDLVPLAHIDEEQEGYALADDPELAKHFGPDRYVRTEDGEIVFGFSWASDPVAISLSMEKLKIVQPQLFGWRGVLNKSIARAFGQGNHLDQLEMCLANGDSRAAVVLTIEPLRVAAYTDEFDCAVVLRFEKHVDDYYRLEPGDRLLTVNTYVPPGPMERPKDLITGERFKGNDWVNVCPFIADFLTDDMDVVERRKREITEDEWQRVNHMGKERFRKKPRRARDGRPFFCMNPPERWDD